MGLFDLFSKKETVSILGVEFPIFDGKRTWVEGRNNSKYQRKDYYYRSLIDFDDLRQKDTLSWTKFEAEVTSMRDTMIRRAYQNYHLSEDNADDMSKVINKRYNQIKRDFSAQYVKEKREAEAKKRKPEKKESEKKKDGKKAETSKNKDAAVKDDKAKAAKKSSADKEKKTRVTKEKPETEKTKKEKTK